MKQYKFAIPVYLFAFIFMAQVVLAQDSGINKIIILDENYQPEHGTIVIDGRPQDLFKASHIPGAINIQIAKFGYYLGKTVKPENQFYLVAEDKSSLDYLIHQADSIGYSENVVGAFIYTEMDGEKMEVFNKEEFLNSTENYTIIDIRSKEEFEENKIFENALNFPLDKLHEEVTNIPTDKPIVVHCATGYRSTIGSSIILNQIKTQQVMDMGADIKEFRKKE